MSKVSLLGIPVTIRLGRERLSVENTLAYYKMFCSIGLWVVMNDVEDIWQIIGESYLQFQLQAAAIDLRSQNWKFKIKFRADTQNTSCDFHKFDTFWHFCILSAIGST